MRGRKADPVTQAEKGNPGKRSRKPTVADRVNALANAPASSADPLSPPVILGLEEFAGAIRIWNEYAPILTKRNMLDRLDRHSLAMFCYYLDRFWSAVIRLAADGETQRVRTVAGGFMVRDHPAVRHRDDAAKVVFDLSGKFGFTPMDRHKLIREMVGTGVPVGGLFGDGRGPEAQDPQSGDDPDEMIGFASRHATSSARPN